MSSICTEETAPRAHVVINIHALASDGQGIGRIEGSTPPGTCGKKVSTLREKTSGLVVFVRGALPGQRVQARIVSTRKRLLEAELISVLQPSADERMPACIHAVPEGEGCGGCPWQTLRYETQLSWKERILYDALKRIGQQVAPPVLPILPSPEEWGYRNKMEFAFAPYVKEQKTTGNDSGPGLRVRASHAVVPVTACRMQSGRSMSLLAAMRELAVREGLSVWDRERARGLCRFFVVRESEAAIADFPAGNMAGNNVSEVPGEAFTTRLQRPEPEPAPVSGRACLAELIIGPEIPPDGDMAFGRRVAAALRRAVPDLDGFVLSRRKSRSDVAYGDTTLYQEGNTYLVEQIGPLRVSLGHNAFFQINTAAASRLYAEILRMANVSGVRRLWDAYCGVGSIGLYLIIAGRLSPMVELTGIEAMPGGVEMARRNAASLGLGRTRFIHGDVAQVLPRLRGIPDLLIVDPPRAGMAEEVTQSILRKMPARLLYISCNPATLARDVLRLAPKYRLCQTRPVDLFPQTPHVESVSLFEAWTKVQ